ncbi:MAG: rod shape-determining protein MreC [Flavobacteriaceae bacterium]
MQQLIYFLQKYKYFLFFLLLELVAIGLTINNHSFHKSKFISSANNLTGGLYEKVSSLSDYFSLKDQNKELVDENINLKKQLEYYKNLVTDTLKTHQFKDTTYHQSYSYIQGKITKNSYHTNYNFITIDKGINDSINKEMAVINSKGIIGITETSKSNFSRVQSILNLSSRVNAKIKNGNFFGTLKWDGKDYNIVQLIDIPRQAIVKKGDTIITGGMSTIFPEGILIGTVINDKLPNDTSNSIDIKLFNDMSNIKNIYIVKNLNKQELNSLDNSNE